MIHACLLQDVVVLDVRAPIWLAEDKIRRKLFNA